MLRSARQILLSLAVVSLTAALASAQLPKLGADTYSDSADLGFKIKVPDGWDSIPPQPEESGTIVIKYVPKGLKYMQLAPDKALFLTCWILKFDRRKHEGEEAQAGKKAFARKPAKDLQAWLKEPDAVEGGRTLKVVNQKDFTVQKIEATEYDFVTPDEPKLAIGYYAAVFKLNPDVDIAVVLNGPGDPKKWSKWEGVFKQIARTFGSIETKEVAGGTATGTTLRDKVRAEQMRKLATLGGDWKLYETSHYFVITAHTDKAFIEELKQRLERIHEIYEQDYPAAKAEEYRKAGAELQTRDTRSAEEKAQDEAEKAFRDMVNGGADPKELASCSVVRLCKDAEQYYSYGGPRGTAGYWNNVARELVIFDDSKVGGKADTWCTMNHEAFHQYIYYFYGAISPQSWYNEGTGDFYSGYTWKSNRYVLEKFDWRTGTIKEAVREKTFTPLKDFVRLTQQEYYEPSKVHVNYAQGWSLIYFLRTGKKNNAKGWNPQWDSILETYLRVLAMSGKVDQAVDEAFKGVDYDALEAAWIDYTR
jgi:hypothetical protein